MKKFGSQGIRISENKGIGISGISGVDKISVKDMNRLGAKYSPFSRKIQYSMYLILKSLLVA